MSDTHTTFKDLIGRTLSQIEKTDDTLTLTAEDGGQWRFYHSSDCCETVSIEDVIGDLDDLIGSPLVTVEEVTHQNENPPDAPKKDYQDSYTWTFYRFATAKGAVTVRWYGESNGYYSESVDFIELAPSRAEAPQ